MEATADKIKEFYDPKLPPTYSSQMIVEPYTTLHQGPAHGLRGPRRHEGSRIDPGASVKSRARVRSWMSLLEVHNVAKRYGPVVALKSADLVVEPGEIHALLGANGAGKSTLVQDPDRRHPPRLRHDHR